MQREQVYGICGSLRSSAHPKKRKMENVPEWRKRKSNSQVVSMKNDENKDPKMKLRVSTKKRSCSTDLKKNNIEDPPKAKKFFSCSKEVLHSNSQFVARENVRNEVPKTKLKISTKRRSYSTGFKINNMEDPQTAKKFFNCTKIEISEKIGEINRKNQIIDSLEKKIRELELSLSKFSMEQLLDAKTNLSITSDSKVESEKPKRIRYSRRKVVKQNEAESVSSTDKTIPQITSEKLEFAFENTVSSTEEESNVPVVSSDLESNKTSVKTHTPENTEFRSTDEVKTENTCLLEDESNPSLNVLGIQITGIWSIKEGIDIDALTRYGQQPDKFMEIKNAPTLLQNVTTTEQFHLDTDTASETLLEIIKDFSVKCDTKCATSIATERPVKPYLNATAELNAVENFGKHIIGKSETGTETRSNESFPIDLVIEPAFRNTNFTEMHQNESIGSSQEDCTNRNH